MYQSPDLGDDDAHLAGREYHPLASRNRKETP